MTARITRRQTTFWDLVDSSGELRVHFAHKLEQHFASSDCNEFGVVAEHPVLLDYLHCWSSIYLASPAAEPDKVIERIASEVALVVGPWRSSGDYFNDQADALALLQSGFGLLLHAPNPIVALVSQILVATDVKYTELAYRPRRWPMQSFVAGRSFVVAKEFRVERGPNISSKRTRVPRAA